MKIIAKNLKEALLYLNEDRVSKFKRIKNGVLEIEPDGTKIYWSYERRKYADKTSYYFYC